jgi:hypothetical protein
MMFKSFEALEIHTPVRWNRGLKSVGGCLRLMSVSCRSRRPGRRTAGAAVLASAKTRPGQLRCGVTAGRRRQRRLCYLRASHEKHYRTTAPSYNRTGCQDSELAREDPGAQGMASDYPDAAITGQGAWCVALGNFLRDSLWRGVQAPMTPFALGGAALNCPDRRAT